MANPMVYDAREGISAEALDELRAATRLVLAFKDANTAVLGFWRQRPGEPGAEDEQMGVVMLRRFGPMPYRNTKDLELIQPFDQRRPAVWPLADDAQHDPVWTRILAMLQPGDVVRLEAVMNFGVSFRRVWAWM